MAFKANEKKLYQIQNSGVPHKFVAQKEIDGKLVEVPLDNIMHALAFEKDDWEIEAEDLSEPKGKK
jgi:hypothetical protein